jgi:hypothetical protein
MGLILVIGSAIAGFIIAIPLFLVVFPAGIGVIMGSITESDLALGGSIAVAALCFIGYLPILILLSGVLRAYVDSAWTLTYLRLTQTGAYLEADMEPTITG